MDLGDRGFVTGTGETYVGGYTSSSGTNTQAVATQEVDPQSKNLSGPDLSRPVGDHLELGLAIDVEELENRFLDHDPEVVADG